MLASLFSSKKDFAYSQSNFQQILLSLFSTLILVPQRTLFPKTFLDFGMFISCGPSPDCCRHKWHLPHCQDLCQTSMWQEGQALLPHLAAASVPSLFLHGQVLALSVGTPNSDCLGHSIMLIQKNYHDTVKCCDIALLKLFEKH